MRKSLSRLRVIVGATVIDGSGRRAFSANVRIEGDSITRVGRFRPGPGDEDLDARGMIVAPGFIDIHNHSERGLLRAGMKADHVIFDPQCMIDRSTFKEPQLLSVGIEHVFVNGAPVWTHDHTTGLLPGVVLRKNASR